MGLALCATLGREIQTDRHVGHIDRCIEAAQAGQTRKRSFVSTTVPNTRRRAFSRAVALLFCRLGNQRPRKPLSRMVFETAIPLGRCPSGRDARLQRAGGRPRSPLAGAVCGFLRKLKDAGYRSPIGLLCYAVQGNKREGKPPPVDQGMEGVWFLPGHRRSWCEIIRQKWRFGRFGAYSCGF